MMALDKAAKALKKAEKALDKNIEAAYYANCAGTTINIMNIGKLFRDVKLELAAGTDLEVAVKTAIAKYNESV